MSKLPDTDSPPPTGQTGGLTPALRAALAVAESIKRDLDTPPPAGEVDDRVIRMQPRLDELADVMLDLPEPKRTEVFRLYLEVREMVDALVRRYRR